MLALGVVLLIIGVVGLCVTHVVFAALRVAYWESTMAPPDQPSSEEVEAALHSLEARR